jgi:hypothetical protein
MAFVAILRSRLKTKALVLTGPKHGGQIDFCAKNALIALMAHMEVSFRAQPRLSA